MAKVSKKRSSYSILLKWLSRELGGQNAKVSKKGMLLSVTTQDMKMQSHVHWATSKGCQTFSMVLYWTLWDPWGTGMGFRPPCHLSTLWDP